MAILEALSDAVLTSTLQSKSINLGNETAGGTEGTEGGVTGMITLKYIP